MAVLVRTEDAPAAVNADVPEDMMRIFGPPAGAEPKEADPVEAFTTDSQRRHWPLLLPLAALCVMIAGGGAWTIWGELAGTARLLPQPAGPAPRPSTRPMTEQLVIAHSLVADVPAVAQATSAAPPVARPAKAVPIVKPDPDATGCDPAKGEMPASCHAAELALADQQLRLALARAANAGMDPKLLTMFQKRWWQVRQDAETDPAYVTAAYRQLAREIDAARVNG